MKTVNVLVYGNIAVYIKYWADCLKKEYRLRCLDYTCSVSSPLRRHRLLMSSHT